MGVLVVTPGEQPPSASSTTKATSPALAPKRQPLAPLGSSLNAPAVRSQLLVVQLDGQSISDTVAASVASSLIGHILWAKSQIPMPVSQIERLAQTKSTNSRASKLRAELLDSYDTVASHLDTAFTALSTAFARAANNTPHHTSKAYLAITIGPSIGTAKSKIFLAIDGLETKVWGQRDDLPVDGEPEDEEEDSEDEEEDSEEEDNSEEEDSEEDIDEEDPPDSGSDEESPSRPPSPDPHQVLHAAEQTALRTAHSRLSRALFDADNEGHGLTEELSPTQTHILIRAPRRFAHPAWIPRQNVTASLDGALQQFLDNSDDKKKKKGKVEGVRVVCQATGQDGADEPQNEEDELIWWSWDGKLVGFSSW